MTEAITFWLHILAATVWVGPQVFLFVASVPALRIIEDAATRAEVMRVTAYRFGYVAAAAMIVLILTGISNLFQEQDEHSEDLSDFDLRWPWIFLTKMILVGLTIAFTVLHSLVIGPRLLALQESAAEGEGSRRLRALSLVMSAFNLLLAVAILYAAAVLTNHDFSLKPL